MNEELSRRDFLRLTSFTALGVLLPLTSDIGSDMTQTGEVKGWREVEQKIEDINTAFQNCTEFVQAQQNYPPINEIFAHPEAFPDQPLQIVFRQEFFPYTRHERALKISLKLINDLLQENSLRRSIDSQVLSRAIDFILQESVKKCLLDPDCHYSPEEMERESGELLQMLLRCWVPGYKSTPQTSFGTALKDGRLKVIERDIPLIIKEIKLVEGPESLLAGYDICTDKLVVNVETNDLLDEDQKNLLTDFVIAHELGHSLDLWDEPDTLSGLVGKDNLAQLLSYRWQVFKSEISEFLATPLQQAGFNQLVIQWLQGENKEEAGNIRNDLLIPIYNYLFYPELLPPAYVLARRDNHGQKLSVPALYELVSALKSGDVKRFTEWFSDDPVVKLVLSEYPKEIAGAFQTLLINSEYNSYLGQLLSIKNGAATIIFYYELKALSEGKIPFPLGEEIKRTLVNVPFYFSECLANAIAYYYVLGTGNPLLPKEAAKIKQLMRSWPEVQYFEALKKALGSETLAQLEDLARKKVENQELV